MFQNTNTIMNDAQSALNFFFALMWASAIAGSSEYRAFDTASCLNKTKWNKALPRFLVGNIVCNIIPLYILYHLNEEFKCLPVNSTNITAAAIASLSVFSAPRILHAVMATGLHEWFYTETEWEKVHPKSEQEDNVGFWAHLIPGLLYLFVTPIFSLWWVGKLQGFISSFCH